MPPSEKAPIDSYLHVGSSPIRALAKSVAVPAAEARRALIKDETSAARLPSQPKQAMCAADEANEANEVESARLTPELSRAEGVGLND